MRFGAAWIDLADTFFLVPQGSFKRRYECAVGGAKFMVRSVAHTTQCLGDSRLRIFDHEMRVISRPFHVPLQVRQAVNVRQTLGTMLEAAQARANPLSHPGDAVRMHGNVRDKEKEVEYQSIIVEVTDRVGLIRLNRPKALNALNDQLMDELGHALRDFDANSEIGCIVLTGSDRAFAAGADISAMAGYSYMDAYKSDFITRNWEQLRSVRKPVIAAVAGYAFGGGCEVAMMCDFIIAAENAKFSQPEVKLGIIPGAGGTQRLPRAVSKAKAMDMCLTARVMDATEAERAGLVSRVVPTEKLLDEAMDAAQTIASMPLAAVLMIKESINRAYESPLSDGVMFERRLFHSTFATEDQKEGMAAFLEKRLPRFRNL